MRHCSLLLVVLALALTASASVRALTTEFEVNVPVEKAWNAWTTNEGVRTFFAPGSNIEAKVDGMYEIYFAPDAKPGMRGADGMRILSLQPNRRLAFTWNAPPSIPTIRGQRTIVVVDFTSVTTNRTRLRFTHMGWGEGEDWDKAYNYFDHAWNDIVLPRFRYAMENGPIDWKNVPQLKPVVASLKEQ